MSQSAAGPLGKVPASDRLVKRPRGPRSWLWARPGLTRDQPFGLGRVMAAGLVWALQARGRAPLVWDESMRVEAGWHVHGEPTTVCTPHPAREGEAIGLPCAWTVLLIAPTNEESLPALRL